MSDIKRTGTIWGTDGTRAHHKQLLVRESVDGSVEYLVGDSATNRDGWARLSPDLVSRVTWSPLWERIEEYMVPDDVRFDVPQRNQGQTIEVAYGGFGKSGHDDKDPYKRVVDQSVPPSHHERATYYKRTV